jgi:uncharacterized protein
VLINVSTLLREPLGSSRIYNVVDEPVAVPGLGYARTVTGRLHLLRSERGVLVRARLGVRVPLECGRCLRDYDASVQVEFAEEYVDPEDERAKARGRRVDPDDFVIDRWRHLDLSEAVRQYEQSALPLLPVCREECEGFCPVCGQDLNQTRCSCRERAVDHRWDALATLGERLKNEEGRHGGPEA